jgi:hypothetical protein
MRLVFAVLICIVLARAQQQPPSPEAAAIAQLQGLADRVKSALASGNLAAANRLATELGSAISRHERALTFAQLEAALPADGVDDSTRSREWRMRRSTQRITPRPRPTRMNC